MCDRVEAVADSANFAELTNCHGGNVQFVSIQTEKSRFIKLSGFSEVRNHVLSYFFSGCDMASAKIFGPAAVTLHWFKGKFRGEIASWMSLGSGGGGGLLLTFIIAFVDTVFQL